MNHNYTQHTISATASAGTDAPHPLGIAGRVLNLRADAGLRIAGWNVQTLRDDGARLLTAKSLSEYRVGVACLSEVRLPGTGHKLLQVPGADSAYHLYHSGVSDNSGLYGVAIALADEFRSSLLEWEAVSPRIAWVRLKSAPVNVSIISLYAPTLAADDSVKDDFYGNLQRTVDRIARSDLIVIAGDWNARPGVCDAGTRHVVDKFAVRAQCANCERLVNFASSNRLVVSSTRFDHPRHHLVTWYSNDGHTQAQIDHILVRARWASSVLDCRAYRGADTGNAHASDHVLQRATLRLRLRAIHRPSRPQRIDVAKLKSSAGDAFHLALQNRFDGLCPDARADPEPAWQSLKAAMSELAYTHLGKTWRRHRDWITRPTLELAEEAGRARLTGSPTYRELRRQTTRAIRADRNAYWSDFATETERAATSGDTHKLYRLLKQASRGSGNTTETLLDRNGAVITKIDDRLERWREHFCDHLNHDPPVMSDLSPSADDPHHLYECNTEPPSVEEVVSILLRLRNNKAPGEDDLPPELFKCAPEVIGPWLQQIFAKIWDSEVVPSDWKKAVILPLFKKGDRRACSNYRGISLIDVAAKTFTSLLLKRFQTARDQRTRPNQSGFRPGRGCTDQIFNLRRVLELRWGHQQPTVLCFIDFAAAFDSVDRSSLWNIMRTDGLPPKLLNLMQAYYRGTSTRVRTQNGDTEAFSVRTGVRQGCALSPTLFNYAVDWIMTKALGDFPGVQFDRSKWMTDLAYADDVVLFGDNCIAVQQALDKVNERARSIGLRLNATKTQVMLSCVPPTSVTPIVLDGAPLEVVDSFRYLGSLVTETGQGVDEVVSRVNRARSAFYRLCAPLWNRREISLRTKSRVYQAVVRSILLYGGETWPMRVEDMRRLEVFDNDCLRRILRHRRVDRIRCSDLRRRCHLDALPPLLLQRRLRWFGHASRRDDGELIRDLLVATPPPTWHKRRGGQLKTWTATVKQDLSSVSGPCVYGLRRWNREWMALSCEQAQDRRAWTVVIRDAVNVKTDAGSTRPR